MALTDAQERTILRRLVGLFREVKEDLTIDDIKELIGRAASDSGLVGAGSDLYVAGTSLGDASTTVYFDDGEEHAVTGNISAPLDVTLSPYGATNGQLKVVTVRTAQPFDVTVVNGGPDGNELFEARACKIAAGKTGRLVWQFEDGNVVGVSGNWKPGVRRYINSVGEAVDPAKWGRLVGRFEPADTNVSLSGALIDSLTNLVTGEFAGDSATCSGAARPSYSANAWNGSQPGITFGGTHYLQANSIASHFSGEDTAFTWVFAIQLTSVTTAKYIISCGSSTDGDPVLGVRTTGSAPIKLSALVSQDSGAGTSADGAATLSTNRMIVTVSSDGTTISSWINGAPDIVAQPFDRDAHTFDRFTIGALGRAAVAAQVSAVMGGILIYKDALSETMRVNAERYLQVTKGWSV